MDTDSNAAAGIYIPYNICYVENNSDTDISIDTSSADEGNEKLNPNKCLEWVRSSNPWIRTKGSANLLAQKMGHTNFNYNQWNAFCELNGWNTGSATPNRIQRFEYAHKWCTEKYDAHFAGLVYKFEDYVEDLKVLDIIGLIHNAETQFLSYVKNGKTYRNKI